MARDCTEEAKNEKSISQKRAYHNVKKMHDRYLTRKMEKCYTINKDKTQNRETIALGKISIYIYIYISAI